jgi:cytochrome c oxidase assembly protein subunit 15
MGVSSSLGRAWTGTLDALAPRVRALGWASLVANVVLVVTGGAVRLTASGLGCPTWPRCTDESFTPHGAMDVHSAIEFGNRTLTGVLAVVAVLTFLSAWGTRRRDLFWISLWMGLGIPAQAVIGGITVLTDLNPWIVSFHLLCSLAIIALAVLFLRRIDHPDPVVARGPVVTLAWLTFAAAWAVLYVGTVVTGSGPHAGDLDVPRNGLDPVQTSQLHADAVFLLIGLTIGLLLALRATGAAPAVQRAARWLLVIELAQGLVGFVQYFTDLPVVLVGVHMLGAAAISATVTWALISVREDGAGRGSAAGPDEKTAAGPHPREQASPLVNL